MLPTLGLFGPVNAVEIIILAFVGLLIFGRRLPEVGKNLGKGIVEFKKGLSGIDDDVNRNGGQPPYQQQLPPQHPQQQLPPQQPQQGYQQQPQNYAAPQPPPQQP